MERTKKRQWRCSMGCRGSCSPFEIMGSRKSVGKFSYCRKILVQKCQIWGWNSHFDKN